MTAPAPVPPATAKVSETITNLLGIDSAPGGSKAAETVRGLTIMEARDVLTHCSDEIQVAQMRIHWLTQTKQLVKRELLGEATPTS